MELFFSPYGYISKEEEERYMEELFEIWEFRFVDKSTHSKAVIYARKEETALEIINMWNEFQDIYHWVKKKFRFKKKMVTSKPPYELEQEQIECIEAWKNNSYKTNK